MHKFEFLPAIEPHCDRDAEGDPDPDAEGDPDPDAEGDPDPDAEGDPDPDSGSSGGLCRSPGVPAMPEDS